MPAIRCEHPQIVAANAVFGLPQSERRTIGADELHESVGKALLPLHSDMVDVAETLEIILDTARPCL